MDPAFPDIVGEWAHQSGDGQDHANDNLGDEDEFVEIFVLEIARREIEATRVW
jgi:hypothetical protein